MNAHLICPYCSTPLIDSKVGADCHGCHRKFEWRDGILSFLAPDERFNEGDYTDKQIAAWTFTANQRNKIRQSKLLSFLNRIRIKHSLSGRRDRIFIEEFESRNRADYQILDIGCGGGRHYLCDYGTVIGIDPVLPLLKMSKKIYTDVFQCGGFNLPFADGSFDYVVSTDVIGHVKAEDKDLLFSEMFRVLKPGGRTIHCIETDATNRMFKFAHAFPELFQKHFVERPGHFGLELSTACMARFERHGFKPITYRKLFGTIEECGNRKAWFDNEYAEASRLLRLELIIDKILSSNILTRELMNFILELLSRVDDDLTPLDYGWCLLCVYEKL